ncbi:MAG TPA: guanylate kinase [Alphaproteobacteria bacterium]|nr:guanylate kinase [Alphaproteobacteria bacterium]
MSARVNNPPISRRGLMLVLSSPSGAGKTSIARAILAADNNISMSVSVTTRPQRAGEKEGVDYHFIDAARFETMASAGELLEHAEVFGNRYGTPRAPVDEALEAGRDVLFDIDWQGAKQIEEAARSDLIKVFILPPSFAALESRLKSRERDPGDVVAKRMALAMDEIDHWSEYDYVVVNAVLDESVAQVRAILAAERLQRRRQTGLVDFVNRLRDRG